MHQSRGRKGEGGPKFSSTLRHGSAAQHGKKFATDFVISPCILPNLANSWRETVFLTKSKRQPSFSYPHQLTMNSKKIWEIKNLGNPSIQKFYQGNKHQRVWKEEGSGLPWRSPSCRSAPWRSWGWGCRRWCRARRSGACWWWPCSAWWTRHCWSASIWKNSFVCQWPRMCAGETSQETWKSMILLGS